MAHRPLLTPTSVFTPALRPTLSPRTHRLPLAAHELSSSLPPFVLSLYSFPPKHQGGPRAFRVQQRQMLAGEGRGSKRRGRGGEVGGWRREARRSRSGGRRARRREGRGGIAICLPENRFIAKVKYSRGRGRCGDSGGEPTPLTHSLSQRPPTLPPASCDWRHPTGSCCASHTACQ